LITQFGRACKELDIEIICANTPQAKGRVERQNQTQQDRLVKELRLAGISTIDEANRFLDEGYWEKNNLKFAIEPASSDDVHRKLLQEHNLNRILCLKEQRTLSKNLELQYENKIYQIVPNIPSWSLRKARVTIIIGLEKEMSIEYKGKDLSFRSICEQEVKGQEVDSKRIDNFLKTKKAVKVSIHHPWSQEGRAIAKINDFKRNAGCI
jgi:hypothetical protein